MCDAVASNEEETAFEALAEVKKYYTSQREAKKTKRAMNSLFEVTLEKALFSSPQACISTLSKRQEMREERGASSARDCLSTLLYAVSAIAKTQNSKYQLLLKMLNPKKSSIGWNLSNTDDRLVIFTERIDTMNFLAENLKKDLKFTDVQLKTLYGGMSDTEIQEIVEEFGNATSKIRILVCSDVASEGINLHYFSHRMIFPGL